MSSSEETQAPPNDDLIDRIAHDLIGNAKGSIVFGDPVERQKVTVVPVASVRYGFGFGRGKHKQDGEAGGGGGLRADPIGYIEIRDELVRFQKIGKSNAIGVLATIGATIVLTLGTIGWAWGNRRKLQ